MSLAVATIDDVRQVVGDALARRDGVYRTAWTVPEVAKSLGTSPDTVRKLIRNGHLATVPHMGNRQLVPVAVLEQFVSASASTSAGPLPPAGVDGPAGSSTADLSGGDVLSLAPSRPPGPGRRGPDPTAGGADTPPAA